jgi:BASS family bile acid:Na+ symporter
MPETLIKNVFLPLALFLIMFGMGLTLSLADFKRVILSPKAKLVGLCCQLLLLPLVALGLVKVLGLSGEIAVGLMLIAACPGGPTSNIITHLAKGDTALSVTLTAFSSVLTVFTLPLIVGASLQVFVAESREIPFPVGTVIAQLIVVTILPIALGMFVRAKRPVASARLESPFNLASIVFLAILIALAVLKEDNLAAQFREAGPAALLLNLLCMGLGFGVAALASLPTRQRVTIAIEAGIQNGTLALAIALGILGSPRIAVPAVVYSLLMFASGGAMILLFSGRAARKSAVVPG